MHDKLFDMAWAMMRSHCVSRTVEQKLALQSEASHPREALEVYRRRVEELASLSGDRAYQEAAGLVARMGRLRSGAEHAAYVATLKERFGRKRNFLKLLA